MDLRALRQFIHLSQTLHYGKTSEAMHVSPSTLSRSIARLEDELGATLFERDNRTVVLTQAGRQFREFAEATLAHWQDLKHRLKNNPVELTGQIRLYCSVTATYSFMSDLLTIFRREFPNIEVILETGDAAQAIQKVMDDEADLAVAPLPDQLPNPLLFKSLVHTPLEFIVPNSDGPVDALLTQAPVPWGQVPFVMAEFGLARKRLDQWFRSQSIKPNIYAQVAGHEAIVAMVGLGLGVGVVPRLVIENSPLKDKIRVLDVERPLQPFDVGICVLNRRLQDPLVNAFWKTAQALHQEASQ
ncbi:HTH-type transcriptional activator IlvY [Reinekea marinisedimentorum]|uniref:LysR family positive regulator for ilvC n=1 Tax=Reinekea marinisedimentorum TaxID=230495 RepID=A0A4R3HTM0_9GAMM|nr:HTH-type transcriptional activator IlvY [Reinekea marinisedimentorum]TCS36422.1 LysR family positive regulator for ilvC [Reinekea marinisedimentorum]